MSVKPFSTGLFCQQFPEKTLTLVFWGKVSYKRLWSLQKKLVVLKKTTRASDFLLIGEHDPVITTGRGFNPAETPLFKTMPVIEVERGGQATYHGPGQLVVYPIIDLKLQGEKPSIKTPLAYLRETCLKVLSHYGIRAYWDEKTTGLWVKTEGKSPKKLASVGLAVSGWVTYHGLALNNTVDLAGFEGFNPCGLTPQAIGRMADWLEMPPSMEGLAQCWLENWLTVIEKPERLNFVTLEALETALQDFNASVAC